MTERNWADADLQLLHSLYNQGLGSAEIAARMDCTEEEISQRLAIAIANSGKDQSSKPVDHS